MSWGRGQDRIKRILNAVAPRHEKSDFCGSVWHVSWRRRRGHVVGRKKNNSNQVNGCNIKWGESTGLRTESKGVSKAKEKKGRDEGCNQR
jgi:hypothetical protein